jgi:hypothetical protein
LVGGYKATFKAGSKSIIIQIVILQNVEAWWEDMDWLWLGGEGPKDIPSWVHVYLVTTLKVPPENLTGLRSVQKIGFWDGKPVTFIRIYDPRASEEAWQFKDFSSLDQHPELVLYEGYWEKESDRVFLERRAASKPQPR